MDNDKTLSVLEDLIETCKDGQKGYRDAAEHVKRADLKTYFNAHLDLVLNGLLTKRS